MVKTPDKIIEEASPIYKKRAEDKKLGKISSVPDKEYKLIYHNDSSAIEPVYFWMIDFMGGPGRVEKLVDNFSSTVGSVRFSELAGKASKMQEEGMKMMQTAGLMVKSLIQLVYDLRQFELTMNDYKIVKSKDETESNAGMTSLKQRWMDNVDMKRGNTSIKMLAMSSQAPFITLIDAFMAANSLEELKKIDLNERAKRILEQRMTEFLKWKELSEKELTRRYKIQKTWLKNQVASLKLYTRWAKPYLLAAQELANSAGGDPSAWMIKAFNNIHINVVLFLPTEYDEMKIKSEAAAKNFPESFKGLKQKKHYRKFYACTMVDFNFRGIPQGNVATGRTEVTFQSFALNEDELALFRKKLDDGDLNDSLNLIGEMTTETLKEIREDIEYFLKDDNEKAEEEQEKRAEEDVNPFTALLGIGKKPVKKKTETQEQEGEDFKKKYRVTKEKMEELEKNGVKKDNYVESVIREYVAKKASEYSYVVYDIYKKAHGMASSPAQV